MNKLAIDVDGVIANFTDAYAHYLFKETGVIFPKASNEWPEEWFWERSAGVTAAQEKKVWGDHILSSRTFWQDLRPVESAQEAIYRLNRMSQNGDEVSFITNRPGTQSKYQTEKFLYGLGMNYPTVIVAADKLPILKAMKIEFFIDDRPDTVQEVGLDASVGRIYLKDAPYNRSQIYPPTVKRITTLVAALEDAYGI